MEKITAEEAARRLGVNLRTLWRWRDAGRINEAGRSGRTVMFYAVDVDRLRGIDVTRDLTLADVYMRLSGVESWNDVASIKADVAATLCTHASDEGRDAIAESYRAACMMAAAHPDEDVRERWRHSAHKYAGWLGMTAGEADASIRGHVKYGTTYEKAKEAYEAAPYDPAYVVAKLAAC